MALETETRSDAEIRRMIEDAVQQPGVVPSSGPKITRGKVTVATNGANQANSATITHGFKRIPTTILCTCALPAAGDWALAQVFNVTATTFQINVFHRDAGINFAADTTVYWEAVA